MKIKTSDLTDTALNWAVHYAQCLNVAVIGRDRMIDNLIHDKRSPSTDWAQGGPIIERERISPTYSQMNKDWQAAYHEGPQSHIHAGPTPLIAAMRCYVASVLGDEVDVPEGL